MLVSELHIFNDLYWFHEIVDELSFCEAVTLQVTCHYVGWLVNVNDGMIWRRYRILHNEITNNPIIVNNSKDLKIKQLVQPCFDWCKTNIDKFCSLDITTPANLYYNNNRILCENVGGDEFLQLTPLHENIKEVHIFYCLFNLDALHSFTNITKLIFWGVNNPIDLAQLNNLTNLKELIIPNPLDRIINTHALLDMKQLTLLVLFCNYNYVDNKSDSIDFSHLANLCNLKELGVTGDTYNIDYSNHPNLTHLHFNSSTITDLSFLHASDMPLLKYLNCNYINIVDYSPLHDFQNLTSITISPHNDPDIQSILDIPNLQSICFKPRAPDLIKQIFTDAGIFVKVN